MKTTKLFIVINEVTLKSSIDEETNEVAKFETEKQADEWASERLEMWSVAKIHFNHKFIHHYYEDKTL
jgi:hypothetical protein